MEGINTQPIANVLALMGKGVEVVMERRVVSEKSGVREVWCQRSGIRRLSKKKTENNDARSGKYVWYHRRVVSKKISHRSSRQE